MFLSLIIHYVGEWKEHFHSTITLQCVGVISFHSERLYLTVFNWSCDVWIELIISLQCSVLKYFRQQHQQTCNIFPWHEEIISSHHKTMFPLQLFHWCWWFFPVLQQITLWSWFLSNDWSACLCVQQVEDELSSPVVLFKFGQEMSAGKGHTHWTQNETIPIFISVLQQEQNVSPEHKPSTQSTQIWVTNLLKKYVVIFHC